ncbi:MAG: LacI family DNA-binding transcriptional regulator [Rariglobus sp.]
MPPPVTMRTVAAAAGVHQTTVSLALRNHPRIPAATRERIRRLAQTLGYRVNPLVAALSASRRRRGKMIQATLGYVTAGPGLPDTYGDLLAGVRARAEELGYGVDHLRLGEAHLTPSRFLRITEARGIHGLIIAPLEHKTRSLHLDWSRFATVAYGYSLQEPDLHRVTPDFYHGMNELLVRARSAGFKRPGLVLDANTDRKADHFWLSAFLTAQHLAPARLRIAPLRMTRWNPTEFTRWLRAEKPDALIGLGTMLDRITASQTTARAPALPQFTLNASADDPRSGNRIDRTIAGATCVDLVVGMLHRNERDIPRHAHNLLVKTTWHEGVNAPPGHR